METPKKSTDALQLFITTKAKENLSDDIKKLKHFFQNNLDLYYIIGKMSMEIEIKPLDGYTTTIDKPYLRKVSLETIMNLRMDSDGIYFDDFSDAFYKEYEPKIIEKLTDNFKKFNQI